MDLTWSLYEAGYTTTFCHQALAYTYDPETFAVYTKQMRRWASGFFQNFQTHYGQVLRSPSALLVVGSLLFDLLMMPVTYIGVFLWARHDLASLRWLVPSMAVHAAITIFIASRTITWKQAIVGFPCYWLANWWNKAIYLWTFDPRVDPRPPLHLLDGKTRTSDRDHADEQTPEDRPDQHGRRPGTRRWRFACCHGADVARWDSNPHACDDGRCCFRAFLPLPAKALHAGALALHRDDRRHCARLRAPPFRRRLAVLLVRLELLGLAVGLVGFTLTYIRGDEGGVAAFGGAPLSKVARSRRLHRRRLRLAADCAASANAHSLFAAKLNGVARTIATAWAARCPAPAATSTSRKSWFAPSESAETTSARAPWPRTGASEVRNVHVRFQA